MRTYGHACGVAKALDAIGDRWTLLIVRELIIRGACRYTDLLQGLPGIATNLLAQRLNELTEAGLISREAAPPPVAAVMFRLTERGTQLEPVIAALGRWGAPLLARGSKRDVILGHWSALPIRNNVRDASPAAKPARLEIRSGGEPMTVETVGDGSVTTRVGSIGTPALTLDGPSSLALDLLMGRVSLETARKRGLKCAGNPTVLRRFRPSSPGRRPAGRRRRRR